MNKFLDEDITFLNLNNSLNNILKNNNIYKVNDLWLYNKNDLKNIGVNNNDIKEIVIKLELLGLELNKKYNK